MIPYVVLAQGTLGLKRINISEDLNAFLHFSLFSWVPLCLPERFSHVFTQMSQDDVLQPHVPDVMKTK